MPEETVILEEPNIKITNLRAIIENKTYPIANITSVGTAQESPKVLVPLVLIFGGVMALMVSIPTLLNNRTWDNQYSALTLGFIAITIGVITLRSAKTTHILQLATAAGEVKAYTSTDPNRIQKISEALNTAIIQKG